MRLRIPIALAAALVAAPLSSQQTVVSDATPPASGPSLGNAVALTIQRHLESRDLGALTPYVLERVRFSWPGFNGTTSQQPLSWAHFLDVFGRQFGWYPLRLFSGFTQPLPPGQCHGPYCFEDLSKFASSAPGVLGDADCDEYVINRPDVPESSGFMVPSVPLAGSGPINQDEPTFKAIVAWNPVSHDTAATPIGAVIWGVHNYNTGRPKSEWIGFNRVSATGTFIGAIPPRRDPVTGGWINRLIRQITPGVNSSHWSLGNIGRGPGDSKPCPGEGAGGDFHFYAHWGENRYETNENRQNKCTFYAPNFALGPYGYSYPAQAFVDTVEQMTDAVLRNPTTARCAVSAWAIAALADRLFRRAAGASGYVGPAYEPISPADARVPGFVPNGSSYGRAPSSDWPTAAWSPTVPPAPPAYTGSPVPPSQAGPPAGYVPPQGSGGGGDPGGNSSNPSPIDVSHPTVDEPDWLAPEVQMPDWLPSFSDLIVPQGSGECPVFGFEAFDRDFEMSNHCGFIENNRITIASIMLVVFAFGAYSIILRA